MGRGRERLYVGHRGYIDYQRSTGRDDRIQKKVTDVDNHFEQDKCRERHEQAAIKTPV